MKPIFQKCLLSGARSGNPCRILLIPVLMLFFQFGLATKAHSQNRSNSKANHSWSNDSPYGRLFDTQTMTTVSGEVVQIQPFEMKRSKAQGVFILLATKSDTVHVNLAPSWFMDNQMLKITKNMTLKVTGSRARYEGQPILIASTLIHGSDTIQFRNPGGYPRWNSWAHQ